MTTYVRATEAARRLGVSTATLYAYVSRGRIGRTTAADGRASLFDVEEVEALRERSRRVPAAPPPTIDVRISSGVTQLDEDGLSYRDHRVESLIARPFEDVAELLWNGALPATTPEWRTAVAVRPTDDTPTIFALIALATELHERIGDVTAPDAARALLAAIPVRFCGTGATDNSDGTGSFAERLARIWIDEPSDAFVEVVNTALVVLADHELATSTLAVRVAASVRASPLAAIIAGLATVEGALHGSASHAAHEMLIDVERDGAAHVLAGFRAERQPVPGFGHSIYRRVDPRFEPLLDRGRSLPDPLRRSAVVDDLLRTAGATVPKQPNIDLALAAFAFIADLPIGTPLFAIARIAGWTAHYLEELDERPLRYRGLARPVAGDAITRARAARSDTPSLA